MPSIILKVRGGRVSGLMGIEKSVKRRLLIDVVK